MSDTFDHEGDAWDSLDYNDYDADDGSYTFGFSGGSSPRLRGRVPQQQNPNYYHSWQHIDAIIGDTEKAIHVMKNGVRFWLAKKLIRSDIPSADTEILVHTRSFNASYRAALYSDQEALDDLPEYED
jgi:hypothetical protein